MGDRRFQPPYERLLRAADPARELSSLSDDEVIQALAHSSRAKDPFSANILATEAINRMRRSRLTLEQLGEAVLSIDTRGRITSANFAARRLLGYSADEMLHEDVHELLHFQDREGRPIPREDCALIKVLETGKPMTLDTESFTRKDGARVPISCVYAPVHADGEVSGAVVAFRPREAGSTAALPLPASVAGVGAAPAAQPDRAREEIAEPYRLLIEGVHDYAIFLLDPEGRIASWNPGAARLYGHAVEDVLGKHFSMFYPDEAEAKRHAELELEQAILNGTYEEEGWRVRRDGTQFWASALVTVLRDETSGVRGFAKITRDLTERRAAQANVRESEQRYREIVENSPEPIAIHAEGRLVFINRAGARLIGAKDVGELLGRNVMDFIHPDSRALVLERLQQMQNARGPLPPIQERLVRLDGAAVDVETVAIPTSYNGEPAVQVILRDITHRRQAEAEREAFLAELERRVRERTSQLEQALSDLETFTNSASHDLRAPLRGMASLLEYLETAAAQGDLDEVKELAQHLQRENSKAVRLVRDLLFFARSGRGSIERTHVDVTALAREVAADISTRHPDRRTQWRVADGMRAYADPGLLRIALDNLLSNASKYSSKAEVPRVEVSATEVDGGTTVRVRDNGVGFPSSEAYRLFSPFNRLSTARGFEGTGLGLPTAYRIVTRHGGRIEAESEPGAGSVFTFWLPGPEKAQAAERD